MARKKGSIRRKGEKFYAYLGRDLVGIGATEQDAQGMIEAKLVLDAAAPKDPDSVALVGAQYMLEQELMHRRRRGETTQFRSEWSVWNKYVVDSKIWRMRVKDVTQAHIQDVLDNVLKSEVQRPVLVIGGKYEKRGTGKLVGERTAVRTRKRLHHFFNTVDSQRQNPVRNTKVKHVDRLRPPEDGDRVPHLHVDEVERLLALKELTLEHRAIFAIGIFAGLRTSEIWGLGWEHIIGLDTDEPELWVRHSYSGPVKGENAYRELALLPQAVEAIKAFRASLLITPIGGLMFPGADGKCRYRGARPRWEDKRYRSQYNGDWLVRLGYRTLAKIRPHLMFRHLRHTCGMHLLAGTFTGGYEWPIEKVSQMLGHSSVKITEGYYVSRQKSRLHSEVRRSREAVQASAKMTVLHRGPSGGLRPVVLGVRPGSERLEDNQRSDRDFSKGS